MTLGAGDVREYKGFRFILVQGTDGLFARLRRMDREPLRCDGKKMASFETMVFADGPSVLEHVKALVDSGALT
jgi:hypothetical protein